MAFKAFKEPWAEEEQLHGAAYRKRSASFWWAAGSHSSIPSTPTCPPAHSLCHLCLPCFLSCRQVLDSLVSLVVLDNRRHGERKS